MASSPGTGYYVLVANLMKNADEPTIVHSNQLYKLLPNNEAKHFRPKHDKDFHKNVEYGRKLTIDGELKMVRHIIYAMNADAKALKAYYDSRKAKDKRFVGCPRKSTGLVCDTVKNYSFPDDDKKLKAEKRKLKQDAKAAIKDCVQSQSKKIMTEFLNKNANESKKGVTTESTAKTATGSAANDENKFACDSEILCPESLTEIAKSVIAETEAKWGCSKPEHLNVLERAESVLKENELLKRENEFLKLDVQSKLADVQALLQGNKRERSEERNPAATPKDDYKIYFKKSKISKIDDLANNLLSDDEEVVPDNKVKVGCSRYVTKKQLKDVEEKATYLTARIEKLCDTFYDGEAGLYSISSKVKEYRIGEDELQSIAKILQKMKWTYATDVTPKLIRTRVIKYTSEVRKNKRTSKEKDKKGKPLKASSKSRKEKPETDDETSEEEEEKKIEELEDKARDKGKGKTPEATSTPKKDMLTKDETSANNEEEDKREEVIKNNKAEGSVKKTDEEALSSPGSSPTQHGVSDMGINTEDDMELSIHMEDIPFDI